ncbi:hypothetical protein SAY87_019311 [Trapa incisa]|uniref:Uncharacterized protein n=1 Tax=Trapa incisa TaxID=236973 RepID=A0AAN7JZQ1_9MYRT|nr:hypothetical protein SAY87_019311 [Trapa incisa]
MLKQVNVFDMGRKGGWFSAVRKALISDYKEKKDQRPHKSKKRWFGGHSCTYEVPCNTGIALAITIPPSPTSPLPSPSLALGDLKLNHVESDQNGHAHSLVLTTAAAVEAAEVVRLTPISNFSPKSSEIAAAVKIQRAFRTYTARRASRAPGGMVRLKNLMEGRSVKIQTTRALQCMQSAGKVQSQIRTRRIRMSEQNRALEKQLEHRREKEQVKLKLAGEWNDSTRSKEQIEKRLQNRQEASIRRERALAYAFSHQQTLKNSRSSNSSLTDPNNPTWGWSWLERWMAARPWETRSLNDFNNQATIKSATSRTMSTGEATRPSYSNVPSSAGQNSARRSLASSYSSLTLAEVQKQLQQRPCSPSESNCIGGDEDTRSVLSIRSEKPHYRRHSIAGSLMPTSTKSTKASSKPRFDRNGPILEKGSIMAGPTAKKSLSSQKSSPAGPRRLPAVPGPPKVENWQRTRSLQRA